VSGETGTASTGQAPGTSAPAYAQVEHGKPEQHDKTPGWQRWIWIGCSVTLLVVIVALCLIGMFALKEMMLLLRVEDRDHLFQFAGMNLVTGGLLRLLAILIGGTIAFVGLAVSFYAHQKSTSLDAALGHNEQQHAKAALVTYSPGIIAIIIGAAVIISAIYARGTYNYRPGAVSNQGAPLDANPAARDLPSLEALFPKPESQHVTPPPPVPEPE
jgi:hypothetical protein